VANRADAKCDVYDCLVAFAHDDVHVDGNDHMIATRRVSKTAIIYPVSTVTRLWIKRASRHRASTCTYSLTFRVRVTTPQQYG